MSSLDQPQGVAGQSSLPEKKNVKSPEKTFSGSKVDESKGFLALQKQAEKKKKKTLKTLFKSSPKSSDESLFGVVKEKSRKKSKKKKSTLLPSQSSSSSETEGMIFSVMRKAGAFSTSSALNDNNSINLLADDEELEINLPEVITEEIVLQFLKDKNEEDTSLLAQYMELPSKKLREVIVNFYKTDEDQQEMRNRTKRFISEFLECSYEEISLQELSQMRKILEGFSLTFLNFFLVSIDGKNGRMLLHEMLKMKFLEKLKLSRNEVFDIPQLDGQFLTEIVLSFKALLRNQLGYVQLVKDPELLKDLFFVVNAFKGPKQMKLRLNVIELLSFVMVMNSHGSEVMLEALEKYEETHAQYTGLNKFSEFIEICGESQSRSYTVACLAFINSVLSYVDGVRRNEYCDEMRASGLDDIVDQLSEKISGGNVKSEDTKKQVEILQSFLDTNSHLRKLNRMILTSVEGQPAEVLTLMGDLIKDVAENFEKNGVFYQAILDGKALHQPKKSKKKIADIQEQEEEEEEKDAEPDAESGDAGNEDEDTEEQENDENEDDDEDEDEDEDDDDFGPPPPPPPLEDEEPQIVVENLERIFNIAKEEGNTGRVIHVDAMSKRGIKDTIFVRKNIAEGAGTLANDEAFKSFNNFWKREKKVKKARRVMKKKEKKIDLIDNSKLTFKIDLAMKRARVMDPEEIEESIKSFNEEMMTPEIISILNGMIPNNHHALFQKISEYTGDVNELDRVSKFFLRLSKIENIKLHLVCWNWKLMYSNLTCSIPIQLRDSLQVIDLLQNSSKLHKFLKYCLMMSNMIQKQKVVYGFKLKTLEKMFRAKSGSGESLMVFIIQHIQKKNDTECLDWGEDFQGIIDQAARADFEMIKEDIGKINVEITRLERLLSITKYGQFKKEMTTFLENMKRDYKMYKEQFDQCEKGVEEIAKLYQESVEHVKKSFFQEVKNLVLELDRHKIQVKEKKSIEEKKRLREAKMKRISSNKRLKKNNLAEVHRNIKSGQVFHGGRIKRDIVTIRGLPKRKNVYKPKYQVPKKAPEKFDYVGKCLVNGVVRIKGDFVLLGHKQKKIDMYELENVREKSDKETGAKGFLLTDGNNVTHMIKMRAIFAKRFIKVFMEKMKEIEEDDDED